jgi:glycosyltransferase involved in cell wall biosynthesis
MRTTLEGLVTPRAVSVVLPVRDAASTLEEAVSSVLASRDVDLELLCIDDGSTDGSSEQLRAFARRDARVKVISTGPRGIVAALNAGLGTARAPLIARMDADDAVHPQRFAEQLAYLGAHPEVALVSCQIESFREGGLAEGYRLYTEWVNGLVSEEEISREAFVECPVPHPTWMFRREVIQRLGGYRDEPWPEDLDLIYRLMARSERIAKVAKVLHRWRDHPDRLSRRDARYAREAFARVKAHHIGRIHPMRAAIVWGAGRTGRRWVRLLAEVGLTTEALLDINPGRIGTRWRGIPILSPDRLADHRDEWLGRGFRILAAVASRGARQEIRAALRDLDLREGNEFLMVA